MRKEKWVCIVHDQAHWQCIEEDGYFFHVKNPDWDNLSYNKQNIMNKEFQWTDELKDKYISELEAKLFRLGIGESFLRRNFIERNSYKPVLFTTEDGVDVYEGDNYWYVSKDGAFLSAWEIQRTNSNSKPKNVYGCFSTKEKAEEYILMNKPCLSITDLFNKNYSMVDDGFVLNKKQIIELAKSKL